MHSAKVDLPITVTGRHVTVTEAMRDHAEKKIAGLNFDYPKVIDAKVLLDVEKDRHKAEIILHCANHIVIEADTTTSDMYASIDETVHKIARQMRKQKTKMLKSHRPDRSKLRELKESPFDAESVLPENGSEPEETTEEDLAFLVHRDSLHVRELSVEEAVEELELGQRPFFVFNDVKNGKLSVISRRQDGDYQVVCPDGSH